jgi:hypothetical protein
VMKMKKKRKIEKEVNDLSIGNFCLYNLIQKVVLKVQVGMKINKVPN